MSDSVTMFRIDTNINVNKMLVFVTCVTHSTDLTISSDLKLYNSHILYGAEI